MNSDNNNVYNQFQSVNQQPVQPTPIAEPAVQSVPQYTEPFQPNFNSVQPIANKKKFNKKILLLIIIGILVVGLGIFAVSYFMNKPAKKGEVDLSVIYDPDKPIAIKKGDKYGYINTKGEIIIEPQFISADDFVGDYAVVKTNKPADSILYSDEIYQVINKKGKVLISAEDYNKPLFIPEYEIWVINDKLYNSNLKPITGESLVISYISNGYFAYEDVVKGTSGILNHKGKQVFSWDLSSISVDIDENSYSEDLYAVVSSYSENEVDAIVSLKTGKTLFTLENPEDEYLSSYGDGIFYYYDQSVDDGYENRTWLYFHDGELAYTVSKADYINIYDYDKQILEISYGYDYENIGKQSQYEYYDVKNNKILTEEPESSYDDEDEEDDLIEKAYGYKIYENNYKEGLIAGDRIVLPAEYEEIEFINVGLFNFMKKEYNKELIIIQRDDKSILMDINTKTAVATIDSIFVHDVEGSSFLKASIYEDWTSNGYIIFNVISGKSMTVDEDAEYEINSNYVTINKDNKKTYYNTNLEQIYVEDIG